MISTQTRTQSELHICPVCGEYRCFYRLSSVWPKRTGEPDWNNCFASQNLTFKPDPRPLPPRP